MPTNTKLPEEDKPRIHPDLSLRALEEGDESGHNDEQDSGSSTRSKSLTPKELQGAENKDQKGSEAAQPGDDNEFGYHEEGNERGSRGLSRFFGGKNKKGKIGNISTNQKFALGGAVGLFVLIIVLLLLFLSSLKVTHFGQVLAATGYARLNGLMQERTSQDYFDAALAEGEGSVSLQDRTLVDRIKLRDVNEQIADLGREGKLKFLFDEDGNMSGVATGDTTVTLDGITKSLGFGDKFSDLGGFRDFTKVARVRGEFTDQVQAAVGDSLALEPRYVRSRAFATIADNIGFDFSRWRQAGRDLIGKSPDEARIDDAVSSAEATTEGTDIAGLGGNVGATAKQLKSADKLKAYLDETGGVFDSDQYFATVAKQAESGTQIESAAATVSKAALVLSLACMARDAFSNSQSIQQNNETESSRMALQPEAAMDQTDANATTPEAESTAALQLDGAEQSPYYQYDTNEPVSTAGQQIPLVAPNTSSNNIVAWVQALTTPTNYIGGALLGKIPGASDILKKINSELCDAVLTPQGAVSVGAVDIIAQAVSDFLSDGSGGFAEQGAEDLAAQSFISALQKAFVNTAQNLISVDTIKTVGFVSVYALGLKLVGGALSATTFFGPEQGSDYYTRSAIGTSELQNREVRSNYGAPISTADAKTVDNHYTVALQQNDQHQSFFARYFSPHNPFSLTGVASAAVPGSFASARVSFGSFLTQLGKIFQPLTLGKIFSTAFAGHTTKAFADTNFDPYDGLPQWGFSPDELNKMRNDASYSIAENPDYISQATVSQLDGTIGKCFDPGRSQTDVDHDPNCSAANLTTDQAFRYRLYKLDSSIADSSQENLANPTDDNTNNGTTTAGTTIDLSTVHDSSVSVACAPGTNDLGVQTGYYNGQPQPTRLCALPNLPSSSSESTPGGTYYITGANGDAIVNSRVSGAFLALVNGAKADGVSLAATSSFRTMAHQQSLCPCDGTSVAKPGYSNHQLGLAIDFDLNGEPISPGAYKTKDGGPVSATDPRVAPSSGVWVWLSQNAATYGLHQYYNEPWHWSPDGH